MKQILLCLSLYGVGLLLPLSGANLSFTEKQRLIETAKILDQAYLDGDLDTIIAHTYPELVSILGGNKRMKALMEPTLEQMNETNRYLKSTVYGAPSKITEAGLLEVCFIPRMSNFRRGREIVSIPGTLIAIRPREGDWRFMNGALFEVRQSLFRELVPGFPETEGVPRALSPFGEFGSDLILPGRMELAVNNP